MASFPTLDQVIELARGTTYEFVLGYIKKSNGLPIAEYFRQRSGFDMPMGEVRNGDFKLTSSEGNESDEMRIVANLAYRENAPVP
jgi:hypothetical protein